MSTQSTKPIFPEPQNFPEVPDTGPTAPVAAVPAPPPGPKPHVEHSYSPANFVCLRCGSNNIAQGYLLDFNGAKFEQVNFAPKRTTLRFLNSIRALLPNRRIIRVSAEACRDCGAVLATVDPEELRRIERRRG